MHACPSAWKMERSTADTLPRMQSVMHARRKHIGHPTHSELCWSPAAGAEAGAVPAVHPHLPGARGEGRPRRGEPVHGAPQAPLRRERRAPLEDAQAGALPHCFTPLCQPAPGSPCSNAVASTTSLFAYNSTAPVDFSRLRCGRSCRAAERGCPCQSEADAASLVQELDDLQGLSQKEQVGANRTAAAARSMRYPVRVSAYSYELLTAFLQAHRLALPLALLNEHVSLQARPPLLPASPCAGTASVQPPSSGLSSRSCSSILHPSTFAQPARGSARLNCLPHSSLCVALGRACMCAGHDRLCYMALCPEVTSLHPSLLPQHCAVGGRWWTASRRRWRWSPGRRRCRCCWATCATTSPPPTQPPSCSASSRCRAAGARPSPRISGISAQILHLQLQDYLPSCSSNSGGCQALRGVEALLLYGAG